MPRHLNLQQRIAMIDFIMEQVEYLAPDSLIRVRAEQVVHDAQHGKGAEVSREVLATVARDVGRASWVPRIVLARYLRTPAGKQDEWRRVVAAVSNSTAHLLERFRKSENMSSLEEVLAHEFSSQAFHDAERIEIHEVRTHLLPTMWHEIKGHVSDDARTAQALLAKIEEHLKRYRETGLGEAELDAGDIISRVEDWEDRLYFGGEVLDPEKLEAEVIFERSAEGEGGDRVE
jgi:hypothetical protein